MAQVIIFVEGNRIHVDPKFGERGTFIRYASTNFARRNYHVLVRICLLLQIKRTEITKL
jgi:CTP synthase (UTP-ammonia lyase)